MQQKKSKVFGDIDPEALEFAAKVTDNRSWKTPGPGGVSDWVRAHGVKLLNDQALATLALELYPKLKPEEADWRLRGGLGLVWKRGLKWSRLTRVKTSTGHLRVYVLDEYVPEALEDIRLYIATDPTDKFITGTLFLVHKE